MVLTRLIQTVKWIVSRSDSQMVRGILNYIGKGELK